MKHTDLCIGGDKGPCNCGATVAVPVEVIEQMCEALDHAIGWAEHVDWSNGNTDPTGCIDEGTVNAANARQRWKQALTLLQPYTKGGKDVR